VKFGLVIFEICKWTDRETVSLYVRDIIVSNIEWHYFCIRSWLLAKDSEVRGKPLQLGRTYHSRTTLRKTKTAGKATGNHPGKCVIRETLPSVLWHCWLGGMKSIRPVKNGGWWRWALVSPDAVAPSRMVGVSASVNLPLHHKVQTFSSGTGSPG